MADYGTLAEVAALNRFMLEGRDNWDNFTRPTSAEVNKFLDRASGALNVALNGSGFSTPVATPTTAKLMLDDWVVSKVSQVVRMSHIGGMTDDPSNPAAGFSSMYEAANEFVESNSLALKRAGLTVSQASSEGLVLTAMDKHTERADPDNTSREQPIFRRRQWDS